MQVQNLLMPGVSTASPSNLATKRKNPEMGNMFVNHTILVVGRWFFEIDYVASVFLWMATCMIFICIYSRTKNRETIISIHFTL